MHGSRQTTTKNILSCLNVMTFQARPTSLGDHKRRTSIGLSPQRRGHNHHTLEKLFSLTSDASMKPVRVSKHLRETARGVRRVVRSAWYSVILFGTGPAPLAVPPVAVADFEVSLALMLWRADSGRKNGSTRLSGSRSHETPHIKSDFAVYDSAYVALCFAVHTQTTSKALKSGGDNLYS